MFGGKGGTGKTTIATASALYLAGMRPEMPILIVSIDPAHSLGDSLGQEIGDNITPVKRLGNLFAWEIDTHKRLDKFRGQYEEAFETITYLGGLFDTADVSEFLSVSLLGMDEMIAMFDITDILRSGEYGLVILDTASTSYTARLLELPTLSLELAHFLKLTQERYHFTGQQLASQYLKDKVNDFLDKQLDEICTMKTILTNKQTTEFVPVAIAEDMAIKETQRLLDGLHRLNVPVKTIVINRVATYKECPFCNVRWQVQQDALDQLTQIFSGYELVIVPLLPYEVRGKERLNTYAQVMLKQEAPNLTINEANEATAIKYPAQYGLDTTELILFGGKGGAGKTTLATTAALYLSALDKGKRTLIFSIDHTHSLSYSFNQEIDDKVTPVAGAEGLSALEIAPAHLWNEFKNTYRESIGEVFDTILESGRDIARDRTLIERLIELTPPGIDELMGMMKIMDFMEHHQFDRYILDMAPTGHALRLLELPDTIREWFHTTFRLLLKCKRLSGQELDKTAELILKSSHQLRLIEAALRNPQRCQFICVTTAEATSLAETKRLAQRLSQLQVACREVIVNMVVPPTRCTFCSAKHAEQQSCLREFERLGLKLHEVPLFPMQIIGLDALREIAGIIYNGKTRDNRNVPEPEMAGLLTLG